MKRAVIIGFGLLLFMSAPMANAARIIIGGPGDPIPVGLTFTFTSNELGGGFFELYNDSGVPWVNLLIELPNPVAYGPGLEAFSTVFGYRSFDRDDNGDVVAILFFGVGELPRTNCPDAICAGIPYDPDYDPDAIPPVDPLSAFWISLNDPDPEYNEPLDPLGLQDPFLRDPAGAGGWGDTQTFNATANVAANVVPEPTTLVLLMSGLAAMGLYSLRRKRS